MPHTAYDDEPQEGGQYEGRYKAFVRDRDDPDKLGRVRCYCPAVMGTTDSEQNWLGWAEPSWGYGRGGTEDYGMANVPELGTPVWIEFQDGSPDFPVYTGTWSQGETAAEGSLPKLGRGAADSTTDGTQRTQSGVVVPASAAGTPTYPDNRVIKTKAGHVIEVDESAGNRRIRIRHPSGTFSEWTHGGDLVKQILGDLLLWVGGAFKAGVVGDLILGVGATLKLGSTSATRGVARLDDTTTNGSLVFTAGVAPGTLIVTYTPPGGAAQVSTITIASTGGAVSVTGGGSAALSGKIDSASTKTVSD